MVASALTAQIGYLIARTNRMLELDLETRLKPFGLSVDQYRILRCLAECGRLPMGELATNVLVEPANLTKIVDRMTSENLVMRVPDDKDRRRVLVMLAPGGEARDAEVAGILRDHERFAQGVLRSGESAPFRALFADLQPG